MSFAASFLAVAFFAASLGDRDTAIPDEPASECQVLAEPGGKHPACYNRQDHARSLHPIMLTDALLAWLHYQAIFVLVVLLTAEAVLLRPGMPPAAIPRLARYDRLYAASAIAVLVTGALRLTLGAKGPAFYLANPWFHAKIGLFVVIALCSVPPTVRILRWRRQLRQDSAFAPTLDDIRRTRRWIMIEAHLFVLLPLFAALMARGMGL